MRPSWLVLTLVVFTFAISCFTLLSPWQFDRHAQQKAQNEAVARSIASRPQPLEQVLPGSAAPDGRTEWAQVRVIGTYLPDAEVIARLRTVQGEPAYEVLTPLRTTTGSTLLINRGYLRPDQRVRVPDYAPPPTGTVTVVARARADEADSRGRATFSDATTKGELHTYSINSAVVADATGLKLRPGYFQLTPEQPGVLNSLPLPRTEAGPYLSYALQWIAFGVMAILGWLYFTVREVRPGGALAEGTPGTRQRRPSVAEQLAQDEAEDKGVTGDDASLRTRQPTPPR